MQTKPLLDRWSALALRIALQMIPVFLAIMVGQIIGRHL